MTVARLLHLLPWNSLVASKSNIIFALVTTASMDSIPAGQTECHLKLHFVQVHNELTVPQYFLRWLLARDNEIFSLLLTDTKNLLVECIKTLKIVKIAKIKTCKTVFGFWCSWNPKTVKVEQEMTTERKCCLKMFDQFLTRKLLSVVLIKETRYVGRTSPVLLKLQMLCAKATMELLPVMNNFVVRSVEKKLLGLKVR